MVKKMMRLLALLMMAMPTAFAVASDDGLKLVKATLVADTTGVEPGKSFQLAVHFKIDKGWHLYWTNPGDAGQPPTVKWITPEGISIGEAQFPTPFDLSKEGLTIYGYEDEMTLLFDVKVAETFKGEAVDLKADVKWMVCSDVCLPGKTTLSISLPVGVLHGATRSFDDWRAALPVPFDDRKMLQPFDRFVQRGSVILDGSDPSGKKAIFGVTLGRMLIASKRVVWFPPASDRLTFSPIGRPTAAQESPNVVVLHADVRILGVAPVDAHTLNAVVVTIGGAGKRQGYVMPIDVKALPAPGAK